MTHEIIDALNQLRLAFARANLKEPLAIMLESRHEVARFAAKAPLGTLWVESRYVESLSQSCHIGCRMNGVGIGWPESPFQYPEFDPKYADDYADDRR